MKSATFDQFSVASDVSRPKAGSFLLAAFREFIQGLREAREAQALRSELASLDDSVLRDIGIASDEIPRIVAREAFTPRAWQ